MREPKLESLHPWNKLWWFITLETLIPGDFYRNRLGRCVVNGKKAGINPLAKVENDRVIVHFPRNMGAD